MPRHRLLMDLIVLVCIGGAGCLLLRHIESAVDVNVGDETSYLRAGIRMEDEGVPGPSSGVLYSLWFALLSRLQGDPVSLYYLSCRVLTIFLAGSFYCALRRQRITRFVALMGAGWILFAAVNLPVWPKPTHFAAIILMPALASPASTRGPARRFAALLVAALLMAYCRPEFIVTYLLLWPAFAIRVVPGAQARILRRETAAALAVPLAASLALLALVGMPGVGADRYRVFLAFGQHFSLNWTAWHHSHLNPWTDWQAIVEHSFGPVYSVSQAVAADPGLFCRHLLWNAVRTPEALCSVLTLRPYGGPAVAGAAWEGAALLAVLAALPVVVRAARKSRLGDTDDWPLALFAVPGVGSSVVLYPRAHYLVIPAMLVMAWCLRRIRRVVPPGFAEWRLVLPAALLLVGASAVYPIQPRILPNAATIDAMKARPVEGTCYVLDALGDHATYLGRHSYTVPPPAPGEGAASLLGRVHMVIRSPELEHDPRVAGDPEWRRFLTEPESFGFIATPIVGTPRVLNVRQELQPPGDG